VWSGKPAGAGRHGMCLAAMAVLCKCREISAVRTCARPRVVVGSGRGTRCSGVSAIDGCRRGTGAPRSRAPGGSARQGRWDHVGCLCRLVDRKIDRKRTPDGPGCGWWTRDDDGVSSQVRQGFPGSWWTPVDGFALLDTQEVRGSNPLRPTPVAPSSRLGAAALTARRQPTRW